MERLSKKPIHPRLAQRQKACRNAGKLQAMSLRQECVKGVFQVSCHPGLGSLLLRQVIGLLISGIPGNVDTEVQ